jgi:hypothetical protein
MNAAASSPFLAAEPTPFGEIMLPSVKTLEMAFPGCGKQLRSILEMDRRALLGHPAGAARLAECFHPPKTYDIRLRVLDSVAETYGVAYIAHKDDSMHEALGYDYLNTGDSYHLTIVRSCQTGRYLVRSVGDLVERNPKLT